MYVTVTVMNIVSDSHEHSDSPQGLLRYTNASIKAAQCSEGTSEPSQVYVGDLNSDTECAKKHTGRRHCAPSLHN